MKKYLTMRTNRLWLLTAAVCTLLTGCKTTRNLVQPIPEKSIVVLYDNDVHCAIDGYAYLAGLRDAVADTAWTCVVSSGDYLQGGTAGAISKGQYIIDVMKHVGYDAVTLGNHEFDYKVPRMFELLNQLNTPVTCANVLDAKTGKQVFQPYVMKTVGNKKIAFVGVVTPTTMQTESYSFYDDNGDLIYDLAPKQTYALVQQAVNDARSQGADYVIVIAHLGEDLNELNVYSHGLVKNTTGIDVVLDGHTHSAVSSTRVRNKEGKAVLVTQTGTQFTHFGKMVIMPNGNITTGLIKRADWTKANARVQAATDSVKNLMKATTERFVCHSDVDLRILNDEQKQQVRMAETNAGDIVADAFRIMTGADLAMTNGGGIRTQLKKGDLSYGDVVSMLPYDNNLCLVEVTGEKILEVLTANTSLLPIEDGQFPQVSGIKFTAVVADHSVKDVQILNKETNQYEPIDPQKTYLLSTTDYCISGGGFRNTLKEAKVVKDAVMMYSDALVEYVVKELKSHIGEEYAEPQGRITIIK